MYTWKEILDSIIEEMYALFKSLISGNYTGFCSFFVDVLSKLSALREGMEKDAKAKQAQIDDLEAQLRKALEPVVEEGGVVVGGETTRIDYMGE